MKTIEKERWDEKEVKKAARIILNAEKRKSMFVKILDEIVHWILILIILIGNIIINSFIVFLSGLLRETYFYIMIALVAILFGTLIEIPLRDIEKLDKNKHFLSRIMLPLLSLINIYIMIGIKNIAEYFLDIKFEFNPIVAGILYGICLLLPHITTSIIKTRK